MSTTVGPVGNFPRNAHADNFMTAISEGPRRDVLQLAPAECTCDTHLLYNCSNIEKSDEIKVMGAPEAGKVFRYQIYKQLVVYTACKEQVTWRPKTQKYT